MRLENAVTLNKAYTAFGSKGKESTVKNPNRGSHANNRLLINCTLIAGYQYEVIYEIAILTGNIHAYFIPYIV